MLSLTLTHTELCYLPCSNCHQHGAVWAGCDSCMWKQLRKYCIPEVFRAVEGERKFHTIFAWQRWWSNILEWVFQSLKISSSCCRHVLKLYFKTLVCPHILHFIPVPGGSIAQDGDKPCKTSACVFEAPEDMDSMHNYEQVNLCDCVYFVSAVSWSHDGAF
jgi:hypothetical protein